MLRLKKEKRTRSCSFRKNNNYPYLESGVGVDNLMIRTERGMYTHLLDRGFIIIKMDKEGVKRSKIDPLCYSYIGGSVKITPEGTSILKTAAIKLSIDNWNIVESFTGSTKLDLLGMLIDIDEETAKKNLKDATVRSKEKIATAEITLKELKKSCRLYDNKVEDPKEG
jgi:hypothetical protein